MSTLVTIYQSIYETDSPTIIPLSLALKRIQEGKQASRIESIRNGSKAEKQKLPIVLFSGVFTHRNDDSLEKHSGLIVLDFDHIDVEGSKKALASDRYIKSCWVSPSGDGIKALVEIGDSTKHEDHFRALCSYFDKEYGLEVDKTGKNVSRACYESFDENIVIKEDSDKFNGMIGDKVVVQTVNAPTSRTDFNKLSVAAGMIRKAEDGEKHSSLIRASVLMGGYIAAGKVEEEVAIWILLREIEKKDVDSLNHARNTICDGIEKGKTMPIRDILINEEEARREIELSDGNLTFISSNDEDLEWIEQYAKGELSLGLTTGNPKLDEYWRFKKEFVMINGHSNVGKTTFMLWMMVNTSIHHDWKWVVYSAENKTASIKMKLMQFAMDSEITEFNHAEIKLAWTWVSEHFTIIDNSTSYSYSDILLFAEKLHRVRPIDGVFIDPYNSLRIRMADKGVGIHEYHYEAASDFLTFSNRLGIAVWVSAHSVTSSQRIKGDDGLPQAPSAPDTEHGGKWVNRADCFLTLHRKVQAPESYLRRTMELHVRKVRETDTGGCPTPFDSPIRFEFNYTQTGYSLNGPNPKLFTTLSEKLVGKQLLVDS